MTMLEILSGKFCGKCHGKVAFSLSDCTRCHSLNVPGPDKTAITPSPEEKKYIQKIKDFLNRPRKRKR